MNLVSPQGLLLPQISAVHVHGDTKRAINRSVHYYLNIEIIARTYEFEDCLNPMRRQFGDRKISRRTEGPEGDFVGPQTLFAWDLHS